MYANTNSTRLQVEAPSLERRTSPCSSQVVVSLSIRSFRIYFPPEFLVVFNRFQCKKLQIFDEKF